MKLEELIQFKVLEHKAKTTLRGRAADAAIATMEDEGKVKLVQMCAKVHPTLYTRLDEICSVFEMSKREFIEAAVAEAVLMAESKVGELRDQEDAIVARREER